MLCQSQYAGAGVAKRFFMTEFYGRGRKNR